MDRGFLGFLGSGCAFDVPLGFFPMDGFRLWPGPSCALNQHLFPRGPSKKDGPKSPWVNTLWPWRWFECEAHAPTDSQTSFQESSAHRSQTSCVQANMKAANTSDYSNCFHCVSATADLQLDKSEVLKRWSLTTTFTTKTGCTSLCIEDSLPIDFGSSCVNQRIRQSALLFSSHPWGMLPLVLQRFFPGVMASKTKTEFFGVSFGVSGANHITIGTTRTSFRVNPWHHEIPMRHLFILKKDEQLPFHSDVDVAFSKPFKKWPASSQMMLDAD